MANELRPCYICGGVGIYEATRLESASRLIAPAISWRVHCEGCGRVTRWYDDASNAGAEWNGVGELKPCPFCGGKGQLQTIYGDIVWVRCSECSAAGPVVRYPIKPGQILRELAVAAWNRRANDGNEK